MKLLLTVSDSKNQELVLVVDFGAQYAQLIARRVRQAQVYSEIVPSSMPIAKMLEKNPKAIACGADAVMMGSPLAKAVESPGKGWHWGSEAHHLELPRGDRVQVGTVGSLEEILVGPSHLADGSMNLFGALRRAMATSGYSDLKEFQRVEVVIDRV